MYHRRRRARHSDSGAHGIDLAPMLDFVLNLLIFFIITAVFAKEVAVDVNRASGGGGDPSSKVKTIPVNILSDGEVVIDGRDVDVRAVRANVEKLRVDRPNSGVLIIAERQARSNVLVQVIDQVHLAGIQDISFGTSN